MAFNHSGIYMIQCLKNKKVYVGQSKNIQERWWLHKGDLRAGTNSNMFLQEDWNQYGPEMFIFSVLEICEEQDLIDREIYWIQLLKATEKASGYNIHYKGRQAIIKGERELHNQRVISLRALSNPVLVINKATGDITECFNPKEVAAKYSVPYARVIDILLYWRSMGASGNKKSRGGNIYVYKADYNPEVNYRGHFKKRVTTRTKKVPNYKKAPEDIIPFADRKIKRTTFIVTSVATGEEQEVTGIMPWCTAGGHLHAKVYKCLNAEWKKHSHHGYYFRYASQRL